MLKRAIVTGGNGFIGSHLVKNLLKNGYEVVVVVRNLESNIDRLKNLDLRFIYCDNSNLLSISSELKDNFDFFFHFAWEGVSGLARKDTDVQLKNIKSTVDAVVSAKALGCHRFIGAGSIMEDESLYLCGTPGKPLPSQYLYGSAKLSAHMLSKTKASELGIDFLWPKITNTYGPGEISSRFINTTLRKILNRERLEFTAGTQNYDFVYIDDVAEAFRLIAENGKNNTSYVVGSGQAKPLRRYVETLHDTIETDLELHFGDIPFQGVNLELSCFDPSNMFSDTGYRPQVNFEEGIQRTFDWIKGVQHAEI